MTTRLENGLPLRRCHLDGTRAVTALIAFDAGTRSERPEENGVAHFLEHLVFKGGESFPTHRSVNSAADRLGARLNALTGHELVAFHIRVRAEGALEAVDLLTDLVGRPGVDEEELARERGVVLQEIARADDQPRSRALDLSGPATLGIIRWAGRFSGPKRRLARSGVRRCWPSASGAGRPLAAAR